MPRRAAAITQADVARALRAVRDAGVRATVEIKPDGTILIRAGDGPPIERAVTNDKPRAIVL